LKASVVALPQRKQLVVVGLDQLGVAAPAPQPERR
jgi:hypothetical protein